MTVESLQRIASLLGEVGSPRVFTARRTAPAEGLHLKVRGVGDIRLPVSRAQARQLCRVARPARYGLGEATLLDRRVRDTWEVPKSRIRLDKRRWNRTLLPVLEELRADLGLPEGCRLKAELHSMLVYARGQFFRPHQDSEKADDMVGTLVVLLPASFRGGTIIVEHQGETVTYRGSKERLSFVAFYADCRHEVRPVRAGHRIVLTYNLRLDGQAEGTTTGAAEPDEVIVEALARDLGEHFETPLPSRRLTVRKAAHPREPPKRLVYLLDHQYTERGLQWDRLKGNDAARAAALRAAAERCGCELVLALAEVQETWSCFEPGWDEPWRGRHRSWRRDEDDEWFEDDPPVDGPDDYELVDLLDWGITLERWIDPCGKKAAPIVTHVSHDEACSTTPSSALEPYASEYEGYMGNYGNTMDRWYRRAAIVLWPKERAFVVRAEASPGWALDELQRDIHAGRLSEARERAASLLSFWNDLAALEGRSDLFADALEVAEGLDAPDLAAGLLQPFRIEELTARSAPAFVALAERYGVDWTQRLLAEWSEAQARQGLLGGPKPLEWIASLPRLCKALVSVSEEVGEEAGDEAGSLAIHTLLRDRWSYLRGAIEEAGRLVRPSRQLKAAAKLAPPILGILESCELAGDEDLRSEVTTFLCAPGTEEESQMLLPCLVRVLRAAAKTAKADIRASPSLETLRRHAIESLEARLDRPERAENDWSTPLPEGCRCKLCKELEAFLSDPAHDRLEWPLNKEGRKHVHRRIDAHELPVSHETRRSGRPYTLELTKTKALFEREARERRSLRADLEWLTKT